MLRRRAHRYPDEVGTRAHQQAAVVELGQRALAGAPLDDLIGQAVESAARELGTDYASVLELTGDGRALLVRGEATVDVVDGVPTEYVEASRKVTPASQMEAWEAGVRGLGGLQHRDGRVFHFNLMKRRLRSRRHP